MTTNTTTILPSNRGELDTQNNLIRYESSVVTNNAFGQEVEVADIPWDGTGVMSLTTEAGGFTKVRMSAAMLFLLLLILCIRHAH